MVVKVYSTSWCPYCHVLMDWLDTLGVKYEEIDAEGMDLQAVPVTEIGDEKIVGLDRPAIKKALKSAGLLK
ncbi:glutaredoxin family protein [Candidatus Saccharibacteria bacterium]|nr:glutaredoxin family protein [Candidatus Saccharibacteria bacterium]